jgi:hypothetical protein
MSSFLRRFSLADLGSLDRVRSAFRALENLLGRTPVHGAHRTITANYSVTDADDLVLVDSTSGAVQVTLPEPVNHLDRTWAVKWKAGGNAVTVAWSGGGLTAPTTVGDTVWYRACVTTEPATFGYEVLKSPGGGSGTVTTTLVVERIEEVPGDEGPMGPPGPAGVAGVAGSAGPMGPAVFLEAEGPDGEMGPMGPPGPSGATGTTGAQGPMGPAVFLEAEGPEGPEGMPIPGPAGAAGVSGATGAQGPMGPAVFLVADPGEDGMMGPPGATGPQGPAGGSVAIDSVSIAFTDGDTARRVTVTDAGVSAASKILGSIRRPDTADDSADRGYVYTANVVEAGSGAFDLLVTVTDIGGLDCTENPPNETVTYCYVKG